MALAPFGRRQIGPAYSARDEILAAVLQHPQKRFVGIDDCTFEVPDEDSQNVGVDQAPDLLLRALAISDVLDCTVEVGGSARLVFPKNTRTIEDAHFAAGTNDAMFHVIVHTTSNGLLLFAKNML